MFGGTAPTALELSPLLYPRRPKKYTHLRPPPPNPHSPSPIPPSLISCSRHNPSQVSAAIDTGLPDDLAIKGVPALLPWGNGSSILIGSSNSVGTSVGRLKLGPCGYDVAHWHAQAWETITPITPGAPISCVFFFRFFSFLAWTYLLARGRERPWGRLHPDTHSSHPPPPHLPSFLFSLSLQPPSSRAPSRAAPRNLS